MFNQISNPRPQILQTPSQMIPMTYPVHNFTHQYQSQQPPTAMSNMIAYPSQNYSLPSTNIFNSNLQSSQVPIDCSNQSNWSTSTSQFPSSQVPINSSSQSNWSTSTSQFPSSQVPINSSNQSNWSTSSSPYSYEIVFLPSNVIKCYGCSQKFADKYRVPPYNIVVKHKDRRIRGFSPNGNMLFTNDFQNTYYHLSVDHITRKNHTFNNIVTIAETAMLALSSQQFEIINKSGLIVSTN